MVNANSNLEGIEHAVSVSVEPVTRVTETDYIKVRSRWLLRYVNGEAFAISDFFARLHKNWRGGSARERVQGPGEFKLMLLDPRRAHIVMDYDYERISDTDYGTYLSFGFPKVVYSQEKGMLVLDYEPTT